MFAGVNGAFDWSTYLTDFGRAAADAGFAGKVLAETSAGPLAVWERGTSGPSTYLSAGMHGDEPAGPLALLEMVKSGLLPHGVHWALCPAANPTGLALGTRENSDGVDLNRDYRRRSTAEVRAHAAWLESRPAPDLFISLHEDWEARGFYFYEINLGTDTPARAATILDAVRPWFEPDAGHEIDGHSPRAPGWIYHEAEADVPDGWPEAIFLAKRGCPLSFTFETPSHAPLNQRVSAHLAAVRAALGR